MLKKHVTFALASFVALLLVVLSGCGPFWVDPYITVKESSLNWAFWPSPKWLSA